MPLVYNFSTLPDVYWAEILFKFGIYVTATEAAILDIQL